jgi:hypothetical protein
MDSKRKTIGLALGVIIIILLILLYFGRESLFSQRVDITYPDGCVEKFKNGVAITPLCTNGRLLQEQQRTMVGRRTPVANFTQGWK